MKYEFLPWFLVARILTSFHLLLLYLSSSHSNSPQIWLLPPLSSIGSSAMGALSKDVHSFFFYFSFIFTSLIFFCCYHIPLCCLSFHSTSLSNFCLLSFLYRHLPLPKTFSTTSFLSLSTTTKFLTTIHSPSLSTLNNQGRKCVLNEGIVRAKNLIYHMIAYGIFMIDEVSTLLHFLMQWQYWLQYVWLALICATSWLITLKACGKLYVHTLTSN